MRSLDKVSFAGPFLALFVAIGLVSAQAQETYFGRTTPLQTGQTVPPSSQSESAKLHAVAAVGAGLASASGGGVVLQQAAIAPVHGSPDGYALFVQDALSVAGVAIQGKGDITRTKGAAEYRYGEFQNGSTKLWKIKFAAVPPNPGDPDPTNFFPASLATAVDQARLIIRANPKLTGQNSGYRYLFQAAYESIVPYTYAANEWRAKAERDRTDVAATPPKTIDDRLTSLNTAMGHYRTALKGLLDFLNHPVDSAYLLSPADYIGTAGPAWANANETWSDVLLESYHIALQSLADCGYDYYYTRYLKEYRQPGEGSFNTAALIADIKAFAEEIDRLLLPVSVLTARNVYPKKLTDFYEPSGVTMLLRRLADSVQDRSLFFSAGAHANNATTVRSAVYNPYFVPFLTPTSLASRPFSFDNFLVFTYGNGEDVPPASVAALPNSLIKSAIDADGAARTAIDDTVNTVEEFQTLRDNTRNEYLPQLGQLCGWRLADTADPSAGLVPDLLGYAAPPGARSAPNLGAGETDGDVALQWNRIEQAETRLLSAYRALAEIDEEAQIIRDYGNERLLSYDRIASIQLNTGEKISALDYVSGEIRANALQQEADQRASQAKKRAFITGALAVVATAATIAVGTAATGGLSNIALAGALASGSVGLKSAYDMATSEVEMHRNIGRIQADAAKAQADITAQQTRIRAVEGASITLEQAGQEENRIKEAIQKLMIRVERQKLEILMAKQARDYAEIELANMVGRVNSLVREYRKASVRQADSGLNRPDLRLRRDYEIGEAARKFRVAQEYSYLLAKAAEYRFRGKTTDSFIADIAVQRANILKAQNGKDLEKAVSALIGIRGRFLQATGGLTPLRQVRLSLRDLVAQSNSVDAVYGRDLYGSTISYLPGDLQPFPQTTPGQNATVIQLSDAQFTDFLSKRVVTNPDGSRVLRISFGTGFERTYESRINPLRNQTVGQYGHVIEGPGPSYVSQGACGVFANIRMRQGSESGMPTDATLQPVGTFYTTVASAGGEDVPLATSSLAMWNPAELSSSASLKAAIKLLYNKDTVGSTAWRTSFNELTLTSAGSQLHERSPANDDWVLTIPLRSDQINNKLPLIRDIEICMTIRGWGN